MGYIILGFICLMFFIMFIREAKKHDNTKQTQRVVVNSLRTENELLKRQLRNFHKGKQ